MTRDASADVTPDLDPADEITERWLRPPSGARIIVADDDRDLRESIASRLAAEGYDVRDALSGIELLGLLSSISLDRWPLDGIDLIVIDQRMPGMTGLETVRRLRAAHWETPALLMTAFPDREVLRDAASLRVSILEKPFSLERLTTVVLLNLLKRLEHPEASALLC